MLMRSLYLRMVILKALLSRFFVPSLSCLHLLLLQQEELTVLKNLSKLEYKRRRLPCRCTVEVSLYQVFQAEETVI